MKLGSRWLIILARYGPLPMPLELVISADDRLSSAMCYPVLPVAAALRAASSLVIAVYPALGFVATSATLFRSGTGGPNSYAPSSPF